MTHHLLHSKALIQAPTLCLLIVWPNRVYQLPVSAPRWQHRSQTYLLHWQFGSKVCFCNCYFVKITKVVKNQQPLKIFSIKIGTILEGSKLLLRQFHIIKKCSNFSCLDLYIGILTARNVFLQQHFKNVCCNSKVPIC